MDANELRQLLQTNREQTNRGWRCPDDVELARYVNGQFEDEKRLKFEAHVAGCKPCLNTIGFLAASEEWPDADRIPAHLLARARELARTEPSALWRWRWAMAPAAAACVVLVVAFIFFLSRSEQTATPPGGDLIAQQQPDHPVVQPTLSIQSPSPAPMLVQKPKSAEAPTPAVRSGTAELNPIMLSPREGAVLRSDQLNFSWKPLTGAVSYEIKVVTEAGGLVFSEPTSQLQLRAGDRQLAPGNYFVTVVAHLPDGRTAKSRMVKFRVVE